MFISSIFKFVLYSTILGSMSAFLIFILKFLFKEKLQIKFINLLWLFLLIRLLIPWAPQTSFSIYNVYNLLENPAIQSRFTDKYQADNGASDPDLNKTTDISNNFNLVKTKNTIVDKQNSPEIRRSYFEISALVWISVCIILITGTALTTIMFYVKLRKKKTIEDSKLTYILNNCRQKMGIHRNITIISTHIVKSPAVFGLIHPKILLPSNMNHIVNPEQLSCIIFHELAHVKRKDMLLEFIISILRSIHWFNPILLYAFYNMKQDKEIACDEMALNYCSHKKYGYTIIKLLEAYQKSNAVYGMDCIINSKYEIKRRITMISSFKKNSHKLTALSAAVLIIIGGIILTNPKGILSSAAGKNITKKVYDNISESSLHGESFSGKMLVIKNPSKVAVGYTKELLKDNKTTGELALESNALCAINANLIPTESEKKSFVSSSQDDLIIHNGDVVYGGSKNRKYSTAGFTDKNVLISGQYSIEALKKMNVTEAVNSSLPLIQNGKPLLKKDTMQGINPRTAIAQKKDGTVLMVVVDGRSADSIGISLFDLQQLLLKNGAYTAAALDGGSSSTMYYKGRIINKPAYSKGQRPVSSIFLVK